MTTCGTCGTTYNRSHGGSKIEHCMSCHESFTTTKAGDKHRTGEHGITEGPDRRRCRSEGEMLAKGMTKNASGLWMTSGETREAVWPSRQAPQHG